MVDGTSPGTPGPTPAPEAETETTKPVELTVAQKLETKLNNQATTFNKLNGIVHAAYRLEEALSVLTGPHVGFDESHSDVVAIKAVLADLSTYI